MASPAAGHQNGSDVHVPGPCAMAIGPGWFDSSFELRQGLEVREQSPADVSLAEWLGMFSCGPAVALA